VEETEIPRKGFEGKALKKEKNLFNDGTKVKSKKGYVKRDILNL